MTQDEPVATATGIRLQIEKIERGAMGDYPGWMDYLAELSAAGRENVMRDVLDQAALDRWRSLNTTELGGR